MLEDCIKNKTLKWIHLFLSAVLTGGFIGNIDYKSQFTHLDRQYLFNNSVGMARFP